MDSYYLNVFSPIVKQDDQYIFGNNNKFAYGKDVTIALNQAQEEVLLRLINKESFSIEELIKVFDKKTIEGFVKNGVLIHELKDEESIFSRTDAYYEINKLGSMRKKISRKRVMLLGCGGIGTHTAWNLATLGVGEIVLVDYDKVELSNLNRQILYDIHDVGREKTIVLKEKLEAVNPFTKIDIRNIKIDSKEILDKLFHEQKYDLIVKTLDTPENIVYWIDDLCQKYQYRYISGIATASYSMIGPTYIPSLSSSYKDFYKTNQVYEHISGIVPALSINMYTIAGELSTEAFKILSGFGRLKYVNEIKFQNILDGNEMSIYPREYDNQLMTNKMIGIHKNNLLIGLLCMMAFILFDQRMLFFIGFIYILLSNLFYFKSKKNSIISTISNAVPYTIIGIASVIIKYNLFMAINWNNIVGVITTLFVILSFLMIIVGLLVSFLHDFKMKLIH